MATVLIVEGSPPSLSALAADLAPGNHRLVEATDGDDALAKVRAERFDLVIANILLPKMNGFEFVRRMREVPAGARTPVILRTTCDQAEARLLAKACGVECLRPRCSTSEETLDAVAAALRRASPAATEASPEYERIHARSIMVVEDNPMDLDFMLQAFAESSLANPVHICRDGDEALAFIATHSMPDDPDLPLMVLLDLRLPKVDGIEVLRHARQHPVWKQIPFIVITTSREDTDITGAYELGVNSYIVKPVDFAAFAEVVRQIKMFWLLINVPPFPGPVRL